MALTVWIGPWAFASYWLRDALLAGFLVAVLYSARRLRHAPADRAAPSGIARGAAVAIKLGVFGLCTWGMVLAAAGSRHDGPAVELSFPLRDGTYAVLQGGYSPLTNPFHWSVPAERFAIDVVKLYRLRNRARGVAPRDLSSYAVFSDPVFGPCAGEVVEAVDGLVDQPPGAPDPAHPAGNHVVIRCPSANVLLAHLWRSSVQVRAGETVAPTDLIATVGNSGNTTEPHLHISAWRDGALDSHGRSPLPMTFSGRFLTLNSVVVRHNE
jgi:hypothetical protein